MFEVVQRKRENQAGKGRDRLTDGMRDDSDSQYVKEPCDGEGALKGNLNLTPRTVALLFS